MDDLLDSFFLSGDQSLPLIYGTYDWGMVVLSILVAIATSTMAMQLAGMAQEARKGFNRQMAILSGALVLGAGVWSMHFIGMLAYDLCSSATYNQLITMLSMLPSFLAAWMALTVLAREKITLVQLVIGGVLVGAGIGIMHYSGMAAASSNALTLRFDPLIFALSVGVAVVLSLLALWVRFGLSAVGRLSRRDSILWSGLVMGFAISGMHYTGMKAARYLATGTPSTAVESHFYMVLTIVLIVFTAIVITGGVNMLLRYRSLYRSVGQSETRLRTVIETAVDGILMINSKGIVSAFNPAAEKIFGWQADEVIGRNIKMLMPEPDHSQHDGYLSNYERTGKGSIIGSGREVFGQHRSGRVFPMRLAIGKAEVDGENVFVGFVTDTTERHAMVQQLREGKAAAEQAAAAKSTFLANMSHEIRTPMNAIIGFTDVLLTDVAEDRHRRHLKTVRNSARSLLSLLNDILDTAKLERGSMELEIADFSLRELCMQVLASLRINAQKKGLALQLDYPETVPEFFKGDSLRLQQVLLNLLGNAIKFTAQGKVGLEVDIVDGEVHIVVSDTGIGIAEDRLQHIFDPFAQADASMTRRFGGTGLGTTIARQLVELMDGRISVESTLGVGSRFHVHVPLPPGQPVSGLDEIRHIELPPLRILVADDVPQNLELLELAMGRAGHKVVTAADGYEAVVQFVSGRFDVILMDVQMPGLNGLDATRRIRELEFAEGRERTPIIALTASVLEEDQIEARSSGMDGFATKPVELDKLNMEIARLLEIEIVETSLPEPVVPESMQQPIRGSVIDWVQGQQLWGSEQKHKEAIATFLPEHSDSAATFRRLHAVRETEALAVALHRLRGAAGNLALSRVARLVARMEDALREGDTGMQQLPVMFDMLADELANVVDVLNSAMPASEPQASARPVAAIDRQSLLTAVATLDAGLVRGELIDQAYRTLCDGLHDPRMAAVQDAIDAFDFDAARAALAEVRRWLEELKESRA